MTTLQQFTTYIRQRSAMENNTAIADGEMISLANGALGELYGLLVTCYEEYFLTQSIAVLTDGYYQLALPPDLFKIRAVDYNQAFNAPNNLWYTITQFQLPERNQFNNPYTAITAPYGKASLMWRLMQDNITISPQSQCAGAYRIWYVPQFAPLVNLTDTIPANMDQGGWTELAVAIACVRICNKMRWDSNMFEQERAELKQRIQSEAKSRSAAGGKRVANVRFNYTDQMTPTGNWYGDIYCSLDIYKSGEAENALFIPNYGQLK